MNANTPLVSSASALSTFAAEVGLELNQPGSQREVLQKCAESAVRHLDAAFARIWTLNVAEQMLELQASAGLYTHIDGPHRRVPVGKFKIGLIASERIPHLTNSVIGDPLVPEQEWARREGMVAFAGYPMIVEDCLVGVIAMFARHPLTDTTTQALASAASQIAQYIERKRTEKTLIESNEKFHQLTASITDVFWIRSPDMREVHYVSPAFEQVWGRSVAGLYADPQQWNDFILPEDRERVQGAFTALMGDARNLDIEYRIVRSDGEVRWVRARGFQIRDAADKLIRLAGIVTDITAMKQAEEKLIREQARLKFVFDSMPVGAALARHYPDGRLERIINDAHLRICGLTREQDQIPGIYAQITHPEDAARQTELNRQFDNEHSGGYVTEKRYLRLDGKVVWVVFSLQRHNYDDGSFDRLTTVVDITEVKRAEMALVETSSLLETLLQNSTDRIYFKDLSSRFVHFSQSMLKHFQRTSPDELTGRTDADFFTDEHARLAYAAEQEIIRTGKPISNLEEQEIHLDGRVSWVLTSKMRWQDRNGNVIGTMGISKDITARKKVEADLEQANRELLEISRRSGMAEIATNVLHNVGNVLNSVNISATLVVDNMKKSKLSRLAQVVALLREHEHDLGTFITTDPHGKQLPSYLAKLSEYLQTEHETAIREMTSLHENIEHIKGIVAMQQSYARVSGVKEIVNVQELVEHSLRMNEDALRRVGVDVIREFESVLLLNVEKHKILQILVNLVQNAMDAINESGRTEKRLTVRIVASDGWVKITVMDNGVGIQSENLSRIFNHGFTTRKNGHGFGLHSGALAAKEMGGTLTVHSDGPGQGAAFTLELPCQA